MFDEYFNPPTSDVSPVQVAATSIAVDIADSPVSTLINQDTPSTSISSTQEQEQSPIISQGIEESPKTPHFNDDPLHETLHEDSTSQGSSSNVQPSHTPFELLVESITYKEAMLEPSWIESMQEEIHEFERLQVLAAYKHLKPFLSHQGFKISSLFFPLAAAYQEKNNTSKLASSLNKSSNSLSYSPSSCSIFPRLDH
ncbi:hypothetical protein Tco_0666864 [Tanacetum coccineum]